MTIAAAFFFLSRKYFFRPSIRLTYFWILVAAIRFHSFLLASFLFNNFPRLRDKEEAIKAILACLFSSSFLLASRIIDLIFLACLALHLPKYPLTTRVSSYIIILKKKKRIIFYIMIVVIFIYLFMLSCYLGCHVSSGFIHDNSEFFPNLKPILNPMSVQLIKHFIHGSFLGSSHPET